jgi:osmotically-inducible protein OsmY
MHCSARRLVLFTLPLALTLTGCSEKDARSIHAVSSKAWDRTRNVTRQATEKLGVSVKTPDLLEGGGGEVAGRVSARLRWDVVLQSAEIQVSSTAQGVVLSGKVASDIQRRRAVELAEATVGVAGVTDNLTVDPSRR